jgi:hypothetical protein
MPNMMSMGMGMGMGRGMTMPMGMPMGMTMGKGKGGFPGAPGMLGPGSVRTGLERGQGAAGILSSVISYPLSN